MKISPLSRILALSALLVLEILAARSPSILRDAPTDSLSEDIKIKNLREKSQEVPAVKGTGIAVKANMSSNAPDFTDGGQGSPVTIAGVRGRQLKLQLDILGHLLTLVETFPSPWGGETSGAAAFRLNPKALQPLLKKEDRLKQLLYEAGALAAGTDARHLFRRSTTVQPSHTTVTELDPTKALEAFQEWLRRDGVAAPNIQERIPNLKVFLESMLARGGDFFQVDTFISSTNDSMRSLAVLNATTGELRIVTGAYYQEAPGSTDLVSVADFPAPVAGNNGALPPISQAEYEALARLSSNALALAKIPRTLMTVEAAPRGKVPTVAQLETITRTLIMTPNPQLSQVLGGRIDSIPAEFIPDGCYARAHAMVAVLRGQGIDPAKIFAVSRHVSAANSLFPKGVNWGWHVTPIVAVNVGGRYELRAVDPALDPKNPVMKPEEWVSRIDPTLSPVEVGFTRPEQYWPQYGLGPTTESFEVNMPAARQTMTDYTYLLSKRKS